jgi:phosphotriesterase-related protein
VQDSRGQVQTVLGPVAADSLGRTLIHEHLLFSLEAYWTLPDDPAERALATAPVSLETLWWVRQHPMGSRDNLVQADPDLAAAEVERFKTAGGRTLVEVSSHGLRRDPAGLRRIAERTGLNVVAGTGYYIGASHPPELDARSVEQVADEMVREIEEGIDGTGVRAGVIGEIGTTEPLTDNERKVLRAAGRAQRRTGAAMIVHPAPQHRSAAAIGRWLDILESEGAIPGKVVVSHLDERLREVPEEFGTLARRGCMLALDTWGKDYYYETRNLQMPCDPERIQLLGRLVADGLADYLVLAQDICYRFDLTAFGGHGYAHLLANLLPRFRQAGIPEDALDRMLVANPARILPLGAAVQYASRSE